jgi:hypothetical protein
MSRSFFGPISSRRQFLGGVLSIGAATATTAAAADSQRQPMPLAPVKKLVEA